MLHILYILGTPPLCLQHRNVFICMDLITVMYYIFHVCCTFILSSFIYHLFIYNSYIYSKTSLNLPITGPISNGSFQQVVDIESYNIAKGDRLRPK